MNGLRADLDLIVEAAREAGELALSERAKGLNVRSKTGGSPVTNADMAVDALLKARLLGARPDHGWLSEETADGPERLSKRRIFVVDPIDGTVAYMKDRPWWCVPIAIVEDGRPVAAVVHSPALDETFTATAGGGAFLNGRPITASDTADLDDAAVLGDARLFGDAALWPEPWPAMRWEKRNALAYRLALVAAGAFDAAIAPTPKWDWDVAAGALIAAEAGAKVSDHHGRLWVFNRPDPRQAGLVCAAPALWPLIVRRTRSIPLPADLP
ncbi:3'(2'),5'-bisphosphate nucleotidase CysQ [Brevundimonas sp.]|jgi:myo-inositol-1(or 4)-monophosphatase|uniref:3'(2'),5'-bisphosphate nucleotidase CysQ n=1 Tax=Brevundimonas sp. TaxID=1871086 RepID=UPI002E0EEA04|nr:3'(2'),5'-bisphosphate nucleotidase CysQ [Brevundimonas sp.]